MIKEILSQSNFLESNAVKFSQPGFSTRGLISFIVIFLYVITVIIFIGLDYSQRGLQNILVSNSKNISKESYEKFVNSGRLSIYSNMQLPKSCELVVEYNSFRNEETGSDSNLKICNSLKLNEYSIEARNDIEYYRYFQRNDPQDSIPPYSIDTSTFGLSDLHNVYLIQLDLVVNCQMNANNQESVDPLTSSSIELYVEPRDISDLNVFEKEEPITETCKNQMLKFFSNPHFPGKKQHVSINLLPISIINEDSYINFRNIPTNELTQNSNLHRAVLVDNFDYKKEDSLSFFNKDRTVKSTSVGTFEYFLEPSEQTIIRIYSKLNFLLPIFLCLFILIIIFFKLLFIIYDSHSKYMNFINSIYSLEIDHSNNAVIVGVEDESTTVITKNNGQSLQTSLLNNFESERLGPEKFRKLNMCADGSSIINSFIANSKTNKGKAPIEATFIKTSFVSSTRINDTTKSISKGPPRKQNQKV